MSATSTAAADVADSMAWLVLLECSSLIPHLWVPSSKAVKDIQPLQHVQVVHCTLTIEEERPAADEGDPFRQSISVPWNRLLGPLSLILGPHWQKGQQLFRDSWGSSSASC